ncbi:uncharacterized protein K489DRAFT_157708 [Dissoconium aciculare CBS 342.82]|uniref:Calcofluor white hypersensitive protein n=1 Tax=Dissoconium aciculare CBS 342.82 TaxID=1314786 RepID=A0A6J3MBQ0_9PEZI|nr:uncharacterized protein K489DRAFT_157708 [Dissoconium aciculare CBS 342.82]KAF1825446.1 hypothetical protein K489DRAFT_157708 [Dissoconium aciculare CBS 342.82]
MSNRLTTWLGLGAAGAVGYYFYQAGGDPKLAEKKFEGTHPSHDLSSLRNPLLPNSSRIDQSRPPTADAARVSSTVKEQIPGQAKQLQKDGELTLQHAKSSLNSLGKDIKTEASKADAKINKLSSEAASKLDQTSRDVQAAGSKAVNEFDKNVNEGAAKAKSGLSSWFGSK